MTPTYDFVPNYDHVKANIYAAYPAVFEFYQSYEPPVDQWLERNGITAVTKFATETLCGLPGTSIEIQVPRYQFVNEADAMLFKLTFSDWEQVS